jgi:hypothetical protein
MIGVAFGEQQLHLFQREGAPQYHHFALDVDDFEAAYLKMRELEIADGDLNRTCAHEPRGSMATPFGLRSRRKYINMHDSYTSSGGEEEPWRRLTACSR